MVYLEDLEPGQKRSKSEDAEAPAFDELMMTPLERPHRPWLVPGRDAI